MLFKLRQDFVISKLVRKQRMVIHTDFINFAVQTHQKYTTDSSKVIVTFSFRHVPCRFCFFLLFKSLP